MIDSHSSSIFRHAPFRRYFVVMCLSTMAMWITRFLLGWSAWEITESALWVGIVSSLMLMPTFVLSPIFGVVSDRISPRNGMLVSLSSQAILSALIAVTAYAQWFNLIILSVASFSMGCIAAAHSPMRLALIPKLVPRLLLPKAIGISAIVFNLSRILGPAVAGAMIHHFSSATAFLMSSGCFVCAFLFLTAVPALRSPASETKASLWQQLLEGMSYAIAHPLVRLILVLTFLNGVLARSLMELLPAVNGQLIDGEPATLALMTACAGAGSILGGVIMTRFRDQQNTLLNLLFGSLLSGALAATALYWASQPLVIYGVIFYISLSATVVGTGGQALAQLEVDERYRGRVLSFWTVLSIGAPAIGGFVMGALADWVGFGLTLTATATLVVTGLGILWSLRHTGNQRDI